MILQWLNSSIFIYADDNCIVISIILSWWWWRGRYVESQWSSTDDMPVFVCSGRVRPFPSDYSKCPSVWAAEGSSPIRPQRHARPCASSSATGKAVVWCMYACVCVRTRAQTHLLFLRGRAISLHDGLEKNLKGERMCLKAKRRSWNVEIRHVQQEGNLVVPRENIRRK